MIIIQSSQEFLNTLLAAADKKNERYIETFVRSCLACLTKTADPEVKQLFFPNERSFEFDRITQLENEELSARYMLYIISGCQQYPNLAECVKVKSYQHVNDFLTFHSETIGEMIYLLYLQRYLILPESEEEKEDYYTSLAQMLTTTNFEAVTKIVSITHSPALAQLIICALKLLNSNAYNTVLIDWAKSDFFSKEFADLDLLHLLEHYPWLEGYHADILGDDLAEGVLIGAKNNFTNVKEWTDKKVLRYGLF